MNPAMLSELAMSANYKKYPWSESFPHGEESLRAPKKPPKPKKPSSKKPGPFTQPSDPRDLSAVLAYGPGYLPFSPIWTDSRIEQVHAFKRWVFVAVNKICQAICQKYPNVSYLITGSSSDTQTRLLYSRSFPGLPDSYITHTPVNILRKHITRLHQSRKALTPLLSQESLQPVEHNHPLRRLLTDPNDPDTSWSLWYETIMFLKLTGDAFWYLPRGQTKYPEAIWVLPSHWVWPLFGESNSSKGLLIGYEIRPVEGNYLKLTIPKEEVIHFRKPNPISRIDGLSNLTPISRWVDVSEAIDSSRLHAFKNGMTPTSVVQFDGSLNDPSEEMLRRIEAKFITRATGETRSNRPLFVPPGVKVSPLSLKPDEMVWGENAKETAMNTLAALDTPYSVAVNDAKSEDQILFCSQALNPTCSFLGQVITEKLCPIWDPNLNVWWEDFVPDNPTWLEETIKTDLMCGAITPNEVRILRGRQPYPEAWADRPVLPVNMAPLTTPQGGQHQDPNTLLPTSLPDQPNISDEPKTSPFPLNRIFSSNGTSH